MRINTLYSTKEILTRQGRQMELRYYLVQEIRSRMRRGQAQGPLETEGITYGIRIVKVEEGKEEQECIPDLSASMEEAERLLRQMIYGVVTPAAAASVADDWVSQVQMIG